MAATVSVSAQDAGPGTTPTPLPETAEPAKAVREVGGRLQVTGETVEVLADPDVPVLDSSLATKTDTSLVATPRSVTVLDRATLDDLQAINVSQAHDYAPGFSPLDQRGPGMDRGFVVGFYDLRRDGLRTYTWSVRELAAVDRVQYLRGPAGVLYGDGSPGGIVNLMLKKPLPTRQNEVSAAFGGLGFKRFTADATGPLGENRSFRYRVVAAGEWLDDGYANDESRVSVVPMLSVDLGPDTTLHLDGEYYDQRGRGYRHTVPITPAAQHGDFRALPWDLNMASPDDAWRGWNASGGLRLDHRLSPRASLHVAGRYTAIDGDLDFQALAALQADGRTASRFHYREKSEWSEVQSDSFVTVSVGDGRIRHRLVIGIEAGDSTADSEIGVGPAPSLDIYAPVYGPKSPTPALAPSGSDLLRLGFYVQDQMALGERLTLLPALRLSRLRLHDRAPSAVGRPDAVNTPLTPSLGALFSLRANLSLYATYAEGFEPGLPGQRQEDGRALDPVESRSLEAGVKVAVNDRLLVTLAGFGIRQTNVAEADPLGFYRQIGEGESRGFEAEIAGSPARGLTLRASYAYTSTEITEDTLGALGNELPNAPPHKASVWARYRLPVLAGRVALAAGVVHASDRFLARNNRVTIPRYTRLDANAFVDLVPSRLALALVAENLTDARYVTSGSGGAYFTGSPRRLAVTLSARF